MLPFGHPDGLRAGVHGGEKHLVRKQMSAQGKLGKLVGSHVPYRGSPLRFPAQLCVWVKDLWVPWAMLGSFLEFLKFCSPPSPVPEFCNWHHWLHATVCCYQSRVQKTISRLLWEVPAKWVDEKEGTKPSREKEKSELLAGRAFLHNLVLTALLHLVTTPSPAHVSASPIAGQLLCPLLRALSTSVPQASRPSHTWGSWRSVVHPLKVGKYVTWFRLVTSDLNWMELSHSLIQCYPYSTAFSASPFVIYLAEPTDVTEPSELTGTIVVEKSHTCLLNWCSCHWTAGQFNSLILHPPVL